MPNFPRNKVNKKIPSTCKHFVNSYKKSQCFRYFRFKNYQSCFLFFEKSKVKTVMLIGWCCLWILASWTCFNVIRFDWNSINRKWKPSFNVENMLSKNFKRITFNQLRLNLLYTLYNMPVSMHKSIKLFAFDRAGNDGKMTKAKYVDASIFMCPKD